MFTQIRSSKKGISHVGFIISSSIFIAFLFFIFTILSPAFGFGEDKQNAASNLNENVIEMTTQEITKISVDPDGNGCIILFSPHLKDHSVLKQNSAIRLHESYLDMISIPNNDGDLLKIYTSDEELVFDSIQTLSSGCTNSVPHDVGLVRNEAHVSQRKFNLLIQGVDFNNAQYEGLREILGVGVRNFALSLLDVDQEVIEGFEAPSDLQESVFVDIKPVTYFDSFEGSIKAGYVRVVFW